MNFPNSTDCSHHSPDTERKWRHGIAGQGRAEEWIGIGRWEDLLRAHECYSPLKVEREGSREDAKPERLGRLTWVFIFVTAHSIYVALTLPDHRLFEV